MGSIRFRVPKFAHRALRESRPLDGNDSAAASMRTNIASRPLRCRPSEPIVSSRSASCNRAVRWVVGQFEIRPGGHRGGSLRIESGGASNGAPLALEKPPFGLVGEVLPKRFRLREGLSRCRPCVAVGRVLVQRVPADLYSGGSKHSRWEADDCGESASRPFFGGPLQAFQHLFRPERKSAVCIAGRLECTGRNSTLSIWGGLDPLLGDTPQQNILVLDLPMVVGFHAPVRIPRRGARHCTAHLPAQLSEEGSDLLDVE